MGSSLLADTATLRVLFGTAGVVVGVSNGKGTLTFHGKTYPFEVTGASFGATLTQTLACSRESCRQLHLAWRRRGLAGGAGVARLRNAKGVTLVVRGPKLGVGLSVNWLVSP